MYTVHTHILCKQKLLFWMRLIAINRLTALDFSYSLWHFIHTLICHWPTNLLSVSCTHTTNSCWIENPIDWSPAQVRCCTRGCGIYLLDSHFVCVHLIVFSFLLTSSKCAVLNHRPKPVSTGPSDHKSTGSGWAYPWPSTLTTIMISNYTVLLWSLCIKLGMQLD